MALGDLFRVHKDKAGKTLDAVCRLLAHQLGWELRLKIAGALQRSQVCRTQDDVFTTAETWKAAMLVKG